jgi:hypothetical protein
MLHKSRIKALSAQYMLHYKYLIHYSRMENNETICKNTRYVNQEGKVR